MALPPYAEMLHFRPKSSGGGEIKVRIKTTGETGKYQRKMNLLSRKHTKSAELELWLNRDANLGKALPRCSALAGFCSVQFENQNGTTSSFCSRYHDFLAQRKTGFSQLLKFAFALCTTCTHFDQVV